MSYRNTTSILDIYLNNELTVSEQSLENIVGDGLTDAPKGSASCGAQHDVRGSELLADLLGTRLGSGWSRL